MNWFSRAYSLLVFGSVGLVSGLGDGGLRASLDQSGPAAAPSQPQTMKELSKLEIFEGHLRRASKLEGLARDKAIRDLVELNIFEQCEQKGFISLIPDLSLGSVVDGCDYSIQDLFRCYSVSDLPELLTPVIKCVAAALGASGEAQRIIEDVLQPIEDLAEILITVTTNGDPTKEPNFCIGDFTGTEIRRTDLAVGDPDYFATNKCKELPFKKDADWTVLAFSFNIPTGPTCNFGKTEQVTACLGVSYCGDLTDFDPVPLPSVAFGINGNMVACVLAQAAAPTVGISSIIGKGAEAALDFIGGGFSLTNAFEVGIILYNGKKLLDVTATPTIVDVVKLKIKPDKLFPISPNVFELNAKLTRGLGIIAPSGGAAPTEDDVENAIASYQAENDADGDTSDISDQFTSWTVQGFMKGQFGGKFKFSKLPKVGKLLPDTDTIELEQVNGFFATGEQIITADDGEVDTVYPGVYIFCGSAAAAEFIEKLFKWLIQIVGSILDLIPDWIPVDFGSEELADLVDLGQIGGDDQATAGDARGVGITVNSKRLGFFFNLPLIVDEIGVIKINCFVDYESLERFPCEASVDGGLAKYFEAALEAIGDGFLWVINETDEFFNDAGKVIGSAFVSAADDVDEFFTNAFSKDNMKRTANEIADGLIDGLGLDKLADIKSASDLAKIMFGSDTVLGGAASVAVQEISEWGGGLVDDAEEIWESVEAQFEQFAAGVESTLDCAAGAIKNSLQGQGAGCDPFKELDDTLASVGNDIEKALENVFDDVADFFEDVGEVFYSERTSYSYSDIANTFDKYNCQKQKVTKTTKKYVLGIKVDEDTRDVGTVSKESCLRARLQSTDTAKTKYDAAQVKFGQYEETRDDNLDAKVGITLDILNNQDFDFTCNTKWKRSEAVGNNVPLEVTCETNVINKDGSISSEIISLTKQQVFDITNTGVLTALVDALTDATKAELAAKITETMNVEPVACTPTPGPPGDGVDNDCDALTDNEICNYSDRVDVVGNYAKDCRCSPPYLDPTSVGDVSVMCNADLSAVALGRPTVTVDACASGSSSNRFMPEIDTPVPGQDPANACGAGVVVRQHQYIDGYTQTSNIVEQTITISTAPPELDTSLLEPVAYFACEDYVEPGLLAPFIDVPSIGNSKCAADVDEGYNDIGAIEYVGCPENPIDEANHKFKGWNLDREFWVRDECGQEVTHIQRVVRVDIAEPVFDSTPPLRLQSCRVNFEPKTTGFPVASDNCDPAEVLNPDWEQALGSQGGRISYADAGDTTGCLQDFSRTFTLRDRVCNQATFTQSVESSPFEFQSGQPPHPDSSSDSDEDEIIGETTYDQDTLLPTFTYKINMHGQNKPNFFHDYLYFYNENVVSDVPLKECRVEYLEYLEDENAGVATWLETDWCRTRKAFKINNINNSDNSQSFSATRFKIDIDEDDLPYFENIVYNHAGTFKATVSCKDASTNNDSSDDRRLELDSDDSRRKLDSDDGRMLSSDDSDDDCSQFPNPRAGHNIVAGTLLFKLDLTV